MRLPRQVFKADGHTLHPFYLQKALGRAAEDEGTPFDRERYGRDALPLDAWQREADARGRRMEEPRREITAAALALSLRTFVRRSRRRIDQWLGWTDRGL